MLREHVVIVDAEWDAAPALFYLEQLHGMATDSGLPAYVDAAHLAPPANLLMEVRSYRQPAVGIPASLELWSCS